MRYQAAKYSVVLPRLISRCFWHLFETFTVVSNLHESTEYLISRTTIVYWLYFLLKFSRVVSVCMVLDRLKKIGAASLADG